MTVNRQLIVSSIFQLAVIIVKVTVVRKQERLPCQVITLSSLSFICLRHMNASYTPLSACQSIQWFPYYIISFMVPHIGQLWPILCRITYAYIIFVGLYLHLYDKENLNISIIHGNGIRPDDIRNRLGE